MLATHAHKLKPYNGSKINSLYDSKAANGNSLHRPDVVNDSRVHNSVSDENNPDFMSTDMLHMLNRAMNETGSVPLNIPEQERMDLVFLQAWSYLEYVHQTTRRKHAAR